MYCVCVTCVNMDALRACRWAGMPRRLLKMRNDDAIESDLVLTMLMGDVVEPRRNFIESKR